MKINFDPQAPKPNPNPYKRVFDYWIEDPDHDHLALTFEQGIDAENIDQLHACFNNVQTLVLAFNYIERSTHQRGFEVAETTTGWRAFLTKVKTDDHR